MISLTIDRNWIVASIELYDHVVPSLGPDINPVAVIATGSVEHQLSSAIVLLDI
jgi:hypothetical protein